jgi:hypothetical protein
METTGLYLTWVGEAQTVAVFLRMNVGTRTQTIHGIRLLQKHSLNMDGSSHSSFYSQELDNA